MTTTSLEPMAEIRKSLEEHGKDVARELVRIFAQVLMCAEADQICGVDYGARSPDRVNRRNGYRERGWDTRVGSIDLEIRKLSKGTYFPLLEPRKRSENALLNVVAESYVLGVSTRRVDTLAQTLGLTDISKSKVSEIASTPDASVGQFRNRPLDSGPYPYVRIDGLAMKCREGGRVVNVSLAVDHCALIRPPGVRRTSSRRGSGTAPFATPATRTPPPRRASTSLTTTPL